MSSNDDVSENPSRISVKIIEQVKKSGEFDKYRKELVDSIVNSDDMQRIFDNCKEIIEGCLASSSDTDIQKHRIVFMRDFVKDEIKRRRIVDNSMRHAFSEHMRRIEPSLTSRMDELVRTELGMPPPTKEIKQELPDANLELIDMEVSSGGPSSISISPNVPSPRSESCSSAERSKANDKIESKIEPEDNDDDALEKFAGSSCTSSLSCNASDDGHNSGKTTETADD
uniref:TFIIS central domain-containing protein n=1 Tax=Meloidogyne hapla TaxID=6305 RepID=A0A1I8BI98_MELHA